MRIWLKNGILLTPYRRIDGGCLLLEDGRIRGIASRMEPAEEAGDLVLDVRGKYVMPGLIDLHVHGGGGHEVMSGRADEIVQMCHAHSRYGTTSILPTTLAAPEEQLFEAIDAVRTAKEQSTDCNILGIHLEGPFLSPKQAGAQASDSLMVPQERTVRALLDRWDGIRMMGAAPELPGSLQLGRELAARGIVASIAHSDAEYEQVVEAMENGYSDVTHLYSGCSSVHRIGAYRRAGVVEAGLFEDALTVQVIADGKHLPPSLLRLIYKCKGAERMILITDGLAQSAGGGQEGDVFVQGNGVKAILEDGVMKLMDRRAFAGSIATMSRTIQIMVTQAQVPLIEAVRMATANPAARIGAQTKGVLAPGMDADIAVLDTNFEVCYTITGGKLVYVKGEKTA